MLIELAPPVIGFRTALSRLRPPWRDELEHSVDAVDDDAGREDAERRQ
jgi:hypothetical protein